MPDESFTFLQPKGWNAPKGYSNGIAAVSHLVFVAGQIGWNATGDLIGGGFIA